MINKDLPIEGVNYNGVSIPLVADTNLTQLEVNPTIEEQNFTAPHPYDGYDEVKVNAVTKDIDSNIKPENIKKGIDILGVTGTLEGLDESYFAIMSLNQIIEGDFCTIELNKTSEIKNSYYALSRDADDNTQIIDIYKFEMIG